MSWNHSLERWSSILSFGNSNRSRSLLRQKPGRAPKIWTGTKRRMLKTLIATALFSLCSAQPLLLTPYVEQGEFSEARALSAIDVNGTNMGYSAFFSVPSASGQNTNNIFFWFQPCLNDCDPASVPFIIWFQGLAMTHIRWTWRTRYLRCYVRDRKLVR